MTAKENVPSLRILLADDHAIVRDGLKQLLADRFPEAIFGEARTAAEALGQLHAARWDVLLLDLAMPGGGGLDVLNQLKKVQPTTRALVLTMHPEDQYAVRVLRCGASGYLTKESAADELVAAVEKILAGGKYVTASLAEQLVAHLTAGAEEKPHESLSDREYQVLVRLAQGKSVKDIGADLSLSVKTVSTYRTRLFQKLQLKSNADAMTYARREKLIDA